MLRRGGLNLREVREILGPPSATALDAKLALRLLAAEARRLQAALDANENVVRELASMASEREGAAPLEGAKASRIERPLQVKPEQPARGGGPQDVPQFWMRAPSICSRRS